MTNTGNIFNWGITVMLSMLLGWAAFAASAGYPADSIAHIGLIILGSLSMVAMIAATVWVHSEIKPEPHGY